jgi:cyclopropane-fatty-acyl-phospholipid synthase
VNSQIYFGEVSHARLAPVKHNFRYPVYFYAFNLDELPLLSRRSLIFGYNRLRPVAIHDKDYLFPGDAPLREKVDTVLNDAGLTAPRGKIILVTAARYFNYIFNPVSFFYCYDADDHLLCVLAQVNNTFGEMHLYLLHCQEPGEGNSQMVFKTDKQFHVSPFFPLQGRYEFHLSAPGDGLDNAIHYYLDDQLVLIARIEGQAVPLTSVRLARTIMLHPARAALTMPRILWQAAKLYWLRRLPVHHKPVPDHAMTIRPVPPSFFDRLGMKMILKFLARLPEGELIVINPDGRETRLGQSGGQPALQMTVKEYRFFKRVMLSGDIGFGESYTDGDWTTPDLPGLLTVLAANETVMNDRSITTALAGRMVNYLRHLLRPNTVSGSSRNIRQHYDLSNEFFAALLDPTMTYSAAIFASDQDNLEQAQRNKLQMIIEKAGITNNDHVLEIGCGWGSFALQAVRQTGCRVTGITVSQEQLRMARKRVREAGLEERIDIRLCDYRHIEGQFSQVVSIEMLEAVGHAGLKPFFAACDRALQPGGKAVIQVITIPDRKYNTYRFSSDWIRKHIFPGGHLPSIGAMSKAIKRSSTLDWQGLEQYGLDYAKTLAHWRETLLTQRQMFLDMGYDDNFIRTWDYYFSYCEAGFTARVIDLAQIVLTKPEHS